MMTRPYTKRKRAENETETRDRIVAAALALHGEVGPNRTTVSMIADRAGVQRHTVYAHLPDERSILMACSGMHAEQSPPPSPEAWAGINDPEPRLRAALAALYAWYEPNEAVFSHVARDAETNPIVREVTGLRFAPPLAAIFASAATGLGPKAHAALRLALSFYTWRSLVREAGLSPADAVTLMSRTVLAADTA